MAGIEAVSLHIYDLPTLEYKRSAASIPCLLFRDSSLCYWQAIKHTCNIPGPLSLWRCRSFLNSFL